MKIASGIAQGLEYLHEKANPPVIYRDLKSSNIMLDEMNNPKLSDYGLVKLMHSGSKMHLSPQVTTSGYSAPEYERDGELTLKSDVYCFGVVLLELISGRRALDATDDQSLVAWVSEITPVILISPIINGASFSHNEIQHITKVALSLTT